MIVAPIPAVRAYRLLQHICLAVLLLLFFGAGPVTAAPPPWSNAPYSYYAQGGKLEAVLRDFAASFSLSLKIGHGVGGVVNGRFNTQNPTEFMDKLGSVYGFNWFVHAGTLFVNRTDDQRMVSIPANSAAVGQLRTALTSLGILDPRFGWGELPDQGIALISGPPDYVRLVMQTLQSLPATPGGQEVAVFRLKHAFVGDRSIFFRDKEIVTFGLASILRNLIVGSGSSGRGAVNNEALAAMAAPLRASPPVIIETDSRLANGTVSGAGASGAAASGQPVPAGGVRQRTPSIEADIRLNTLIVQDLPERIPVYERLIRELDVPTALIEIQAMIVDVNTQRMRELGVNWGMRAEKVAMGFNNPTAATDTTVNTLAFNWAAVKGAVNPGTVLVDTGNYLVSRIQALESHGDARIHSQPSVLTLENLGAVFDDSRTFYIRVQGERVAAVTPVTAGTTLRVTPRVIESDGDFQLELVVDITDGKIETSTIVDALPTVQRSQVSTQALVGNNETLIIGGYNSEQDLQQTDRVPVLADIPGLGVFFSNRSVERQKRERIFLIKPRIVSLPSSSVGPGEPLSMAPAGADGRAKRVIAAPSAIATVNAAP